MVVVQGFSIRCMMYGSEVQARAASRKLHWPPRKSTDDIDLLRIS